MQSDVQRHVVVIGGGIAGLSAAASLADRGIRVTLLESGDRLGGRVSAWPTGDGRTMSRGFHAFFRQYYNLRSLLRRADPGLVSLMPVEDYPLQRSDGTRDSFAGLPRTPPFSVLGFMRRSSGFTVRTLARVNIPAAVELLRVSFPETFSRYDGESAAAFLQRLRFPAGARDLALEVFARSFFAHPEHFAAGELIAMFHTYFLGSAEGLLFDVPVDDYDSTLWGPLGSHLHAQGVTTRTGASATSIHLTDGAAIVTTGDERIAADAVVLAADPRAARALVQGLDAAGGAQWREQVCRTQNAPPFTVVRLWLDTLVDESRPAFVGTSGYGPVDNVTVLERFEQGAATWSAGHRGSVIELHAYACDATVGLDPCAAARLVARMERELHRIYPETASAATLHREILVRDDCPVITPEEWAARPGVVTPWSRLVLAGDAVRCDYPVALMERAATTGILAADRLLAGWGLAGHDVWTVPMSGLLARPRARRDHAPREENVTTSAGLRRCQPTRSQSG
ncbi:FAD-dependent oxidoreductase [Microbacterium sp. SYP-A9085]|uniref:FAD-dependent oxidoreductase n=1 Tax=Microbacterium sp. SYP-A9085 TaxID=2664454 RepID=UPI0020A6CF74